MTTNCNHEAVQRAVAIIENMIEVTVKNEEHEMTEQLTKAKLILTSSQQRLQLPLKEISNGLSIVKYIVEILSNLS